MKSSNLSSGMISMSLSPAPPPFIMSSIPVRSASTEESSRRVCVGYTSTAADVVRIVSPLAWCEDSSWIVFNVLDTGIKSALFVGEEKFIFYLFNEGDLLNLWEEPAAAYKIWLPRSSGFALLVGCCVTQISYFRQIKIAMIAIIRAEAKKARIISSVFWKSCIGS